MKRFFVLIMIACLAIAYIASADAAYYANLAVVVSVDLNEDLVFVVDANGNMWSFYGIDDWRAGDYANMVLYTNGTETIYDDEIVSVCFERPDLVRNFNPDFNPVLDCDSGAFV